MYRSLSLTIAAAWLAAFAAPTSADSRPTLLTLSNSATGNSVLAFRQKPDGQLKPAGEFPTGGLGSGGGLGNQGSLVPAGDFVLAVNAGSDQLSVLRRTVGGLDLVDVKPSGGARPVSVTTHGRLVYVLNAGSDSIAGFRINEWGKLKPLAGSVLGLSGGSVGAAQIEFAAHGRVLIVTEKATNMVVTFTLNNYGLPMGPQTFASPGATPFGFDVSNDRRVFVSEAAGGAANASSVSSWRVRRDGTMEVIDPTEPTLQSAACWVALTPDGRYAYATNTGSGTTSAFRVRGGRLELIDGGAPASTGAGSAPIDIVVTDDARYVHVLDSGTEALVTLRILADGRLKPLGRLGGLPDGANGLAVVY